MDNWCMLAGVISCRGHSLSPPVGGEARTMDRATTFKLWENCEAARAAAKAAGKDSEEQEAAAAGVWNAWAEEMLARRRALELAGDWSAKQEFLQRPEGGNEQTRRWLVDACADFCNHEFTDLVDCTGWVFPGDASFAGARFPGTTRFRKAKFLGTAAFSGASFSSTTVFAFTLFSREAWFDGATFSGIAVFGKASFSSTAWFDGATFSGTARFDGATFFGEAGFDVCTFERFATFANARFESGASFAAIRSDRGFSLANVNFATLPDFIQAHFVEAPRLDHWGMQRRIAERRRIAQVAERLVTDRSDAPARYRALKRLAMQGHDHEREQAFFAGEITSARWATNWPLPFAIWRPKAWSGFCRFWFGLLYQVSPTSADPSCDPCSLGSSLWHFRGLYTWAPTET